MTTRKKPPASAPRRKPAPVTARRLPAKVTPARPATRQERSRAAVAVESPREVAPPPRAPEPVVEVEAPAPALSSPEPTFAQRVPPPAPARPFPSTRRAIFFDVENTSRAEHIARVIEHLAVDRLGSATDVVAVGNWKVIGQDTARLLARHGAHLIHSAPSTGVRDWSDLRIAVGAGVWVAGARPGDILEIVSDDRAFDAVGDVAASLGIAYRRLSYRALAGMPVPDAVERPVTAAPLGESGHRRRRGRRGGRRDSGPMRYGAPIRPQPEVAVNGAETAAAEIPSVPSAPAASYTAEPHTAPHDEIVAVVRRLLRATGATAVSIDAVANALRAEGFRRTPGSPRLITRLRRIKELSFGRSGLLSLIEGSAPAAHESAPAAESRSYEAPAPEPEPEEPAPVPEVSAFAEESLPGDIDGNRRAPGEERTEAPRSRYRGARRGRGRGRGRGPSKRAAATSAG
jgi:hypothetical protein